MGLATFGYLLWVLMGFDNSVIPSLSGLSSFISLYVLRVWHMTSENIFSLAVIIWTVHLPECTLLSVCLCQALKGFSCGYPFPLRDDENRTFCFCFLPVRGCICICILQASQRAVDLSLGNLNGPFKRWENICFSCILEWLFLTLGVNFYLMRVVPFSTLFWGCLWLP